MMVSAKAVGFDGRVWNDVSGVIFCLAEIRYNACCVRCHSFSTFHKCLAYIHIQLDMMRFGSATALKHFVTSCEPRSLNTTDRSGCLSACAVRLHMRYQQPFHVLGGRELVWCVLVVTPQSFCA